MRAFAFAHPPEQQFFVLCNRQRGWPKVRVGTPPSFAGVHPCPNAYWGSSALEAASLSKKREGIVVAFRRSCFPIQEERGDCRCFPTTTSFSAAWTLCLRLCAGDLAAEERVPPCARVCTSKGLLCSSWASAFFFNFLYKRGKIQTFGCCWA